MRIGWWFYRRAMRRLREHEEYLAFLGRLHQPPRRLSEGGYDW